ncbi:WD40 repeat domain-containing protein [Luteimonas salinilitoris]|uniref:WD40 repeat domain-containing protein n=1 Tax=Luteimonas salinilitoris TaxID=3237697 RepID=A0ABV4HY95_9GAMM
MRARSWGIWTTVLLALCALLALSWWWLEFRSARIDPEFTRNFVDLNRRVDDGATAVAYDPQLKILAVGRESGRLELWDARRSDSRLTRTAHTVRIEHIAFGADDSIVLTSSVGSTVMGLDPNGMPKVWDARSGELLLALPGEWIGGPLAASPVPGFYLIASYDELRVYDHAKRAVVGAALKVRGGVTALTSDKASGLVAVGTGSGELRLLKLDVTGEVPRLDVVAETSTYRLEAGTDVLAVLLRDEGRRLVTVNWLPEAQRHDYPANIAGHQAEIVQWNTQDWRRERTFPLSLQTVHWASYTPGEPWLVLAGNESTRGRIELVDLQGGEAWRYKANRSHPVAVLLPEIRTGLILQSGGATQIRYLDQQ